MTILDILLASELCSAWPALWHFEKDTGVSENGIHKYTKLIGDPIKAVPKSAQKNTSLVILCLHLEDLPCKSGSNRL